MAPLPRLFARDEQSSNSSNVTTKLLIVLLVLVLVSIFSAVSLFVLRRRRRAAAAVEAGTFDEKAANSLSRCRSHGLGFLAGHFKCKCKCKRTSLFVYQEKRDLLHDTSSPPPSPLPEIRITFPEEIDDSGKRQSGRVVVVHVGEKGIGMEPAVEEILPPYQKDASDRFQSLDIERIGGLKEKDQTS